MARRQFVLDVLHPGRPNVSKADLSEKLAALYKTDKNRVVTFGFRTAFGGGRSTGFALIYDDEASQKKFEPRYRLVRVCSTPSATLKIFRLTIHFKSGLAEKIVKPSRKLRKERKNRAKKVPSSLFHDVLMSILILHLVPRNKEEQGCRAPQEGQVKDSPFICTFIMRACSHSHDNFMYHCMHMRFLSMNSTVLWHQHHRHQHPPSGHPVDRIMKCEGILMMSVLKVSLASHSIPSKSPTSCG